MDWQNFVSEWPQARRRSSLSKQAFRQVVALQYGRNKSRTLAAMGRR